jgi:thiol-disulfide isomerase/thioredoxin
MKKTLIIALLIASSAVIGQEREVYDEGYLVKVGDMAPDFLIREAGGKEYRLSDLRGSVVMLQFTASWCGVCRQEMPFIEEEVWKP